MFRYNSRIYEIAEGRRRWQVERAGAYDEGMTSQEAFRAWIFYPAVMVGFVVVAFGAAILVVAFSSSNKEER